MVNFVPLIPKFIMQKSIRLVSGLYLKLSLLTVAVGRNPRFGRRPDAVLSPPSTQDSG